MNATGKTILISALACLTTGHLSCTGELAGAGSETTNGITGFVRNRDGTPAAAVIVKLLSSDFNRAGRDTISGMFIDTTDLRGAYLFTRVDTGSYILIMRDPPRKTGCKIEGIAYRESETLLSAPPGDLVPTGTILIPLGENASDGELVFIPGTDVYTTISGDTAVLEGIPRGSVASVYLTSGTGGPKLICSDVMVNPEDTVRITKPFWLRSGSISVNTTSASGAFLRKPLFGFPALLRLSPENFRFEEAGRGGYDVRFTKTDGSDLPFEISRWDESAQRAEIWIVLDTLHPDTVTRIVMHWGNPDATQAASPNSVFDTSRPTDTTESWSTDRRSPLQRESLGGHAVWTDHRATSGCRVHLRAGYRFPRMVSTPFPRGYFSTPWMTGLM